MIPDYNQYLSEAWGWSDESSVYLAGASNLTFGSNPAYTASDFLALFPKFGQSNPDGSPFIPPAVINAYIALASASILQSRWGDTWAFGMGLFIAHFLTLWLKSDGSVYTTAGQAAAAGLKQGITVAVSAAGVSQSLQPVTGLETWGAWMQTQYGAQFATFAKSIGAGPMVVW